MQVFDPKKCFALVIGIGARPDDAPSMSVTAEDATQMAKEIESRCGYPKKNIFVLQNEQATTKNILKKLDALAKKTAKKEADTAIIYFSGHGTMEGEEGNKKYFLISQDTKHKDLENTAIAGTAFIKKLEAINTKKVLILLDCCHAGGILKGYAPAVIPFDREKLLGASHNRAIIAASHKTQTAYTGSPFSIFTYVLLEGLAGAGLKEGDTNLTLFDLAMYARERVLACTRKTQHPQLEVFKDGATTNFVLAQYPEGKPQLNLPPFKLHHKNKSIPLPDGVKADQKYRQEFQWITNRFDYQVAGDNVHISGNTGTIVINKYSGEEDLMVVVKKQGTQIDALIKMLENQRNPDLKSIATRISDIQKSASIAEYYPAERKKECEELTTFFQSDSENIFAFYGIAQMGKSYTIGKWWKIDQLFEGYQKFRVKFNKEIGEASWASLLKTLLGPDYPAEEANDFRAINKILSQKTIIWFEDFETTLALNVDNQVHEIADPRFKKLFEYIAKNSNVKLIVESRYDVRFGKLDRKVQYLSSKQLEKIVDAYFEKDYLDKGFTQEEFREIYRLTGGNTGLLVTIPDTYDKIFGDKFELLEDLRQHAAKAYKDYNARYFSKILEILTSSEHKLLLELAFDFNARPISDFASKQRSLLKILSQKFLVRVEESSLTLEINYYIRQVALAYYKYHPQYAYDFEQYIDKASYKVGKAYRQSISKEQRLREFEFYRQETPDFLPYWIEVAKAYHDMGENKQACDLMQQALSDLLTNKFEKTILYSNLIHFSTNSAQAEGFFDKMVGENLQPNVITYSSLISKSMDYKTALHWHDTMVGEKLQPNVVTYSSLISKSSDYKTALHWHDTMVGEKLQPNVVTYSSLISKSSDYKTALHWHDTMVGEKLQPNVVTYNSLISRSEDCKTALKWLDKMIKIRLAIDYYAYSSIYKVCKHKPEETYNYLIKHFEPHVLFANFILNRIIIEICFPFIDQVVFFQNYLPTIRRQVDEVIIYYASKTTNPAIKITLAENLKEKDWGYYKMLGEAWIAQDFDKSNDFLRQTLGAVKK